MTPPGFGKDLCPVHRVDDLPVEEVVAQLRIEVLDAAVLQRWRASDPQPEVKRIHDSLRRGSQATALARPTSSRKVAGDPGG